MGTLDYVSPEQAMNAHTVDIRADLYSLGCTFYFLLTGQVPFPGGTAMEKLSNHAFHEPAPVEQFRPDVPPGVSAVVRKLLAKKAEDRFQTPAELAAVLAKGAAVPVGAVQIQPRPVAIGAGQLPAAPIAPPVGADDTIAAGTTPLEAGGRRQQAGKRRRLVLLAAAGLFGIAAIALVMALVSGPPPETTKSVKATPTKPAEPKAGDTIANSIGMKLAYIPAGEFTMGSPDTEANREAREGPQHKVKITKAFYMGAYEVKQREYQEVMGENPSSFKDSPDHPVEQLDWNKAMEFCKKLTDRPEEKTAGRVYRLPTDAEWEYAARAGTTTVFY
jgi:formylglycine-generating enzyme required for sulfatase activity